MNTNITSIIPILNFLSIQQAVDWKTSLVLGSVEGRFCLDHMRMQSTRLFSYHILFAKHNCSCRFHRNQYTESIQYRYFVFIFLKPLLDTIESLHENKK